MRNSSTLEFCDLNLMLPTSSRLEPRKNLQQLYDNLHTMIVSTIYSSSQYARYHTKGANKKTQLCDRVEKTRMTLCLLSWLTELCSE